MHTKDIYEVHYGIYKTLVVKLQFQNVCGKGYYTFDVNRTQNEESSQQSENTKRTSNYDICK